MPSYLSTNTKLRSHRCLQKTSGRRAGARLPIRYETNKNKQYDLQYDSLGGRDEP